MIYKKSKFLLKYILTVVISVRAACGLIADLRDAETLMTQGNYCQALNKLRPYLKKNDPHAHYLAGAIFLSKQFEKYDAQKGVFHLEKAIMQNYAPALDELAGLYLAGEGVKKNEQKALGYYIQGAHLGFGPSQFNCGIMYKEGQGTAKNPQKAYLYLCLASLNVKDLGDMTQDAARYRDETVSQLSSNERQEILQQVNDMTLP